jgi:hypothetical protein
MTLRTQDLRSSWQQISDDRDRMNLVFEIRVLMRKPAPKVAEVMEGRKVHNQELPDLWTSIDIK